MEDLDRSDEMETLKAAFYAFHDEALEATLQWLNGPKDGVFTPPKSTPSKKTPHELWEHIVNADNRSFESFHTGNRQKLSNYILNNLESGNPNIMKQVIRGSQSSLETIENSSPEPNVLLEVLSEIAREEEAVRTRIDEVIA